MANTHTRNQIRNAKSDNVFIVVVYALGILALLIVLLPLLYVVSSSFSSPEAVIKNKVWLLPVNFTINAYRAVFKNMDILIGYRNTIFYAVVGTLVNILMTIALAYPLSKPDFRGRNLLTIMCTITMFFSGGMIPSFLVIKNIGLYNSVWALIIPKSISVWNMFLLRNYFQTSIPSELIESSRVDGASEWRILWQIVLPLSKAILAVLVIFYIVGHWNSYFDAILYLDDRGKYPLQVILREILLQGQGAMGDSSGGISTIDQLMAYESMKYAVIIVASVPVLVLYPFLQRYFVKGIMVGSIKG